MGGNQWRLPLRVERKEVSDFYWLKTPPVPSVANYAVSRLTAALLYSWACIRPLQVCGQHLEARVEHNAPSTRARSWSGGELPATRRRQARAYGSSLPASCPLLVRKLQSYAIKINSRQLALCTAIDQLFLLARIFWSIPFETRFLIAPDYHADALLWAGLFFTWCSIINKPVETMLR